MVVIVKNGFIATFQGCFLSKKYPQSEKNKMDESIFIFQVLNFKISTSEIQY